MPLDYPRGCPACGSTMRPTLVEPATEGLETRMFACLSCGRTETVIVKTPATPPAKNK
jgi:transposase-like protein